MKMLYLVSVFIHIICACIWLGGMFALIIFFIPLRKENYFLDMVNKVGNQFKFVGWIILPLLLLTGIFNSFYRGFYTLTWLKATKTKDKNYGFTWYFYCKGILKNHLLSLLLLPKLHLLVRQICTKNQEQLLFLILKVPQ